MCSRRCSGWDRRKADPLPGKDDKAGGMGIEVDFLDDCGLSQSMVCLGAWRAPRT